MIQFQLPLRQWNRTSKIIYCPCHMLSTILLKHRFLKRNQTTGEQLRQGVKSGWWLTDERALKRKTFCKRSLRSSSRYIQQTFWKKIQCEWIKVNHWLNEINNFVLKPDNSREGEFNSLETFVELRSSGFTEREQFHRDLKKKKPNN